jgi:hypothetical protein
MTRPKSKHHPASAGAKVKVTKGFSTKPKNEKKIL